MSAGFEKRLLIVWLALSSITIVYLWVNSLDREGGLEPSAAITASAIAMALVKVRIVFREFMEVKHAPALLRRLTDLWVVVTAVFLLGAYFAGTAFSMRS